MLRGETFLFSLCVKLSIFWKFLLRKKKRILKIKGFLCKDKSSQNFLKSLVYVKVPSYQNFCLTKPRWWFLGHCNRWKFEKISTLEKLQCCSFVKKKVKFKIYETVKVNLIQIDLMVVNQLWSKLTWKFMYCIFLSNRQQSLVNLRDKSICYCATFSFKIFIFNVYKSLTIASFALVQKMLEFFMVFSW